MKSLLNIRLKILPLSSIYLIDKLVYNTTDEWIQQIDKSLQTRI